VQSFKTEVIEEEEAEAEKHRKKFCSLFVSSKKKTRTHTGKFRFLEVC